MNDRLLKNIRRAAIERRSDDFAAVLQELFAECDHSEVLLLLKTQKLLMKFRDHTSLTQALQAIKARKSAMTLTNDSWQQLEEQFKVCQRMQCIYSEFDRMARAVPLFSAKQDIFGRIVLECVESEQRQLLERYRNIDRDKLTWIEALGASTVVESEGRRLWDAANRLISFRAERPEGSEEGAGDLKQAKILIDLACDYDLVSDMFDRYTYFDVEMRIGRKSVVFVAHHETDLARSQARAAQRSLVDDHLKQFPYSIDKRKLFESRRRSLSNPFDEYLLSPEGIAFLTSALEVCKLLHAQAVESVAQLLDIDTPFSSRGYSFTFRELLSFWMLLRALCLVAEFWKECHSGDELIVTVKKQNVLNCFREHIELGGGRTVETYVEHFTAKRETSMDLFLKPLLPTDAENYILPVPFVERSRIDRNVLSVAIRESTLNQKAKGVVPVRVLRKAFERAGFRVVTDFPLRGPSGPLTDLDLCACKDDHLFICQAKIVVEPDGEFESWKVYKKLHKASEQMAISLSALDSHLHELEGRLGCALTGCRVVALLVTNTWSFTGIKLKNFTVTDLSYLTNLLEGGRVKVVALDPEGAMEIKTLNVFRGGQSWCSELVTLLENPVHEQVTFKPKTAGYRMLRVGGIIIHIPFQMATFEYAKT